MLQIRPRYDPFFITPGSGIPPWFNNQNYFHLVLHSNFHWEYISESNFVYVSRTLSPKIRNPFISIIVDIPHYCLSSEWWGIAVCLVLENQFSSRWELALLNWICRTPGAQLPVPSGNVQSGWIGEFTDPHLCIFLLRGNDKNIERHLRGDNSQLQLIFYAEAIAYDDDESDDPGMLNISKCGCRVLCKEDLEVWGKAMSERKQSNNFVIPSSSLNKSGVREIGDDHQCCDGFKGEIANTSNAEAKRRKLG